MKVTLTRKLDSGGFGDVWEGRDALDREVAVKIIRSATAAISNALDHAKALARTNHPNVVKVHSIESVTDPETGRKVKGVVMELIRGTTLAERLNGARFAMQELRTIGVGVIDGLAHIHAQGLSHGDLHNENVMLVGCDVKIIDILYLNTLAALSTRKKATKLKSDLTQLRFLLQDLLAHSELDLSEATEFNNLLRTSEDIRAIRVAFLRIINPERTDDLERRLKHAYQRVIDDNFVEGDEYASALVDETPRQVVVPLLKKMIEDRAYDTKHRAYVRALWTMLNASESKDVVKALSVRLEEDTPDQKWRPNLRLLSCWRTSAWQQLPSRLRIKLESMITNDVLSGRYDIYGGGHKAGGLGTYAATLWPHFESTTKLLENIESVLQRSWYTQNYIGEHFLALLPDLATSKADRDRMINALRVAVRNDAKIVVNRLSELPKDWVKKIKKANP